MDEDKFAEELTSLRNMREGLKEKLNEFHLAVAPLDFDAVPEASFLFKILTQISDLFEATRVKKTAAANPSRRGKKNKIKRDDGSFAKKRKRGSVKGSLSPSKILIVPKLSSPVEVDPAKLPLVLWQPEMAVECQEKVRLPAITMGDEDLTSDGKDNFWEGLLEWTEIKKDIAEVTRKIPHQLLCHVSFTDCKDESGLAGWFKDSSSQLSMKLIPKPIILGLTRECFEGVKSVNFSFPEDGPSLTTLVKLMANRLVGCVHFFDQNRTTDEVGSRVDPTKLFLLLYSQQRNCFIGFIPQKQQDFRHRLMEAMGQNYCGQ